jgi:hypothetical protein
MKAKFVSKFMDTSYGQHMVYLEYEYRGHRYMVYENRNKGNIPLSWQHANEQSRIDTLIELEAKPTKGEPITTAEIYAIMGWD